VIGRLSAHKAPAVDRRLLARAADGAAGQAAPGTINVETLR
jgi:hypothetical protein